MTDSAGAVKRTEARVEADAFDNYLSALNAIVDEARVHLGQYGLKSEAVDPANVAMARCQLDASAFEQPPTDEHEIGVNVRKLQQVMPTDYGAVDLSYHPDRRKLGIQGGPYGYTYSALDAENIRQEPTLPSLDLTFRAEIDGEFLRETVQWFDTFATHVRVGYDPVEDRFWMEANEQRGDSVGPDDGGVSVDPNELVAVHETGHADSHFSLDYFKDIMSGVPEGKTVEIYIGEEFPMKLRYGHEHGEVEYMQAPRIQSD